MGRVTVVEMMVLFMPTVTLKIVMVNIIRNQWVLVTDSRALLCPVSPLTAGPLDGGCQVIIGKPNLGP